MTGARVQWRVSRGVHVGGGGGGTNSLASAQLYICIYSKAHRDKLKLV